MIVAIQTRVLVRGTYMVNAVSAAAAVRIERRYVRSLGVIAYVKRITYR